MVALPAIIAISSVAIYAGYAGSTLARIPGTPASAAYVEELHDLARRRDRAFGLGISAMGSAVGVGNAGQIPLESLEIVAHGEVVAPALASHEGQSPEHLETELVLPADQGVWIAARTTAGPMQVAHTPVYVTVDGGGFRHEAALDSLLSRSERHLSGLVHILHEPHDHVSRQAWRYREPLMERIGATRLFRTGPFPGTCRPRR